MPEGLGLHVRPPGGQQHTGGCDQVLPYCPLNHRTLYSTIPHARVTWPKHPRMKENGPSCFKELFIYLFIYFWRRWVFVAAHRLSLVAGSGGYSSLQRVGFSLRWLLLLQSTGSRRAGFSSCGSWAPQLWRMGLVAPQHVGSSRTRARTRVP